MSLQQETQHRLSHDRNRNLSKGEVPENQGQNKAKSLNKSTQKLQGKSNTMAVNGRAVTDSSQKAYSAKAKATLKKAGNGIIATVKRKYREKFPKKHETPKDKFMRIMVMLIPCVIVGLLGTKLHQTWRYCAGYSVFDKINDLSNGINRAFYSLAPSFEPTDLLFGIICGLAMRFVVFIGQWRNSKKKFRKEQEYGSARWGTPEDIAPYIDPDFRNNVILTQTERLTMNNRPKDPKTARNKNVLIIGGSGSGKTRFFIKPNLMQMHSSYVVTDPKGSLIVECGRMLQDNHYKISVFNTINFKKSMHYNPFAYVHTEQDILKLVNTLMVNTKGEGKAGDPFWDNAERLLYSALFGYIHYEAPEEEQNFALLLDLLTNMSVTEDGDGDEIQNPVDQLFAELEKDPEKANSFAVRQYKKFKLAAGKTTKSILISCAARLAVFDIAELREITAYDELELDKLGGWKDKNGKVHKQKTALFLIMSDTDATFNFLISMIYTQLFNLLCETADDVFGGRLPVHVRCLIDECANIGQIPNLEKLIATIRSREISACLVLQAQSQLKAIYKDNADTIIGNCDCRLFLGGAEPTTLKELNQALGKETIDMFNTGESHSRDKSTSINYQKLGHELMSVDELSAMDGGKCILQLRGVRPFLSDKYDITQHPNYIRLSDFDKANEFDIDEYVNRTLTPKPDDKVAEYVFNVMIDPEMSEEEMEYALKMSIINSLRGKGASPADKEKVRDNPKEETERTEEPQTADTETSTSENETSSETAESTATTASASSSETVVLPADNAPVSAAQRIHRQQITEAWQAAHSGEEMPESRYKVIAEQERRRRAFEKMVQKRSKENLTTANISEVMNAFATEKTVTSGTAASESSLEKNSPVVAVNSDNKLRFAIYTGKTADEGNSSAESDDEQIPKVSVTIITESNGMRFVAVQK